MGAVGGGSQGAPFPGQMPAFGPGMPASPFPMFPSMTNQAMLQALGSQMGLGPPPALPPHFQQVT